MIPLGVLASAHVAPAGGVPTNGLLLYLNGEDFTNDPQTTTWVDRSAAGNDGTVSNFAYTSASGSDGAGNVVFDGANDIVSCGTTGFAITNGLTIAAWVNLDIPGNTYSRIINREASWGIYLYTTHSPYALRWYGSGVDAAFPSSPSLGGTGWHFIAATYDGDGIDGYIDGTGVGTLSKTGNLTNNTSVPVTIGNRVDLYRPMLGGLGAALIYDRALSAAELSAVQSATERPL